METEIFSTLPGVLAECKTLVDILHWRASHQPQQNALIFLLDGEEREISITYSELDARAKGIAKQLLLHAKAKDRILLLCPQGFDYVAAFMGCLYAGLIAVPAYPPSSPRSFNRIRSILADADANSIVTTAQVLKKIQQWETQLPELTTMHWLVTSTCVEQTAELELPAVRVEDLAFLQYTSGSTGDPKGVMVSHGNLMHNLGIIYHYWGLSAKSVGVSWLPMFHDLGLIAGVLQPLYGGFLTVLLTPATFIQRPLRWLQAMTHYKGTVSYAPNFAYELCLKRIAPQDRAQLDLGSWHVAVNGAEPVRAETLVRFQSYFGLCGFASTTFIHSYGLAEATLLVSTHALNTVPSIKYFVKQQFEQSHMIESSTASEETFPLVGCGEAIASQGLVIVHPETCELCPQNEVGEIWLAGPNVAQGYWRQQEETERTFRAFLADTGKGPFLRTGDLGFLHSTELFVMGRLKDMILIHGRNHYPQDIELTVEHSHEAVRSGCVIALSVDVHLQERLVVVLEVARHLQQIAPIFQAIRQAIAEQHELQVYAIVLLQKGSIPKTSSGKLQRRGCRTAFLAGQLQEVAREVIADSPVSEHIEPLTADLLLTLTPAEQRDRLHHYLLSWTALHLPLSQETLIVPLVALGLDSLRAAELQAHIEKELHVALSYVELLQSLSIEELTTRLMQKIGSWSEKESSFSPLLAAHLPVYPLSFFQEQIWILQQLDPNSAFYTIPVALHLKGTLHSALFRLCLDRLVQRHGALRTRLQGQEGVTTQEFVEIAGSLLTTVDLKGLSAREVQDVLVQEHVQKAAQYVFRLEHEPLVRFVLFSLSTTEHIFLVTMHHIISDGWSIGLLLRELAALYRAKGNAAILTPLSINHGDYALWQRAQAASPAWSEQRAYWKQQLSDVSILDLPHDYSRLARQSFQGTTIQFEIPQTIKLQYQSLCTQAETTLFMAIFAVFQILLFRYSGQEDIVVGTMVAQRPTEALQLIGYFVNTLVINSHVQAKDSFYTVLKHVQKTCLEAYAHQNLPFTQLVAELQSWRDLSHNPIFQVAFSWQPDIVAASELAGLEISPVPIKGSSSKFDLSLNILEREETLACSIEYCTDLFDAATIEQMIAHFQYLLQMVLAYPDQQVAMFDLVEVDEDRPGKEEKRTLEHISVPMENVCVLIEAQIVRTPDAIAVAFGASMISYEALNQHANQLARYLQLQGVRSRRLIGICFGRSIEFIISLLGVLKASCAYVPLDPAYPKERLGLMVEEGQLETIITHSRFNNQLPICACPLVFLDACWLEMEHLHWHNLEHVLQGDDLLYVLYTSGSTGKPKGTAVYQASFITLLRWYIQEFSLSNVDRPLLISSLSFDLTQKNIFAPLLVGGTVACLNAEAYDIQLISTTLYEQSITWLNCTPSAFYPLLESTEDWGKGVLSSLRYVFLGGEPIAWQKIDRWLATTQVEVVNTYGPTECTDVVAYYRLPHTVQRQTIPIGRPIWQVELFVLDEHQYRVPMGVRGELAISGDCVGMGYLNDPALTAERFRPDPFHTVPGSRLYKTGDVVRYRRNGLLDFIGRVDQQVKLRGNRIELGEIEAMLDQHPLIHESVVVICEDDAKDQRLAAYVVLADKQQDERQVGKLYRDLHTYLRNKLTAYMLPSYYIVLDKLPLTPGGKLNRRALPSISDSLPCYEDGSTTLKDELEEALSVLWCELLKLKQVGVHANFFALGGHSLLATQLISRIRRLWNIELPLRCLFESPTIAEMAEYIKGMQRTLSLSPLPALMPCARPANLPLSLAQQRLWILYQLTPDDIAYNMSIPFFLSGEIKYHILQQCLETIVQRHEILRTNFMFVRGEAQQIIALSRPIHFPVLDLSQMHRGQEAEIQYWMMADAQHPFRLEKDFLLRLRLLRLAENKHILVLTTPHIVFDGWSQTVFSNELIQLYEAYHHGLPSLLAALPLQYADFALWQRAWLRNEVLESLTRYWREQLKGSVLLKLPTDDVTHSLLSQRGAGYFFTLPSAPGQALRSLSQREGVTLFMILLAAFQTLLYHLTAQEDILVGIDVAGRTFSELESLLGFFVNILAIRIKLDCEWSFRDLLRYAREVMLGAYAHQEMPFEQLAEILQSSRSSDQPSLINVLFVFQNTPVVEHQGQAIQVRPLVADVSASKFELAFFLWENNGELQGAVNYRTDLFLKTTIQRFVKSFEQVLASLSQMVERKIKDITIYSPEELQQKSQEEAATQVQQRQKLKAAKRREIILPG